MRASDDAAGLSIVQSLNSDARVFAQRIRNINDGVSVFGIVEGALADEFNRIVESVEFNGRKLFSVSETELRIQAGYGEDGGISIPKNKPSFAMSRLISEKVRRIYSCSTFGATVNPKIFTSAQPTSAPQPSQIH